MRRLLQLLIAVMLPLVITADACADMIILHDGATLRGGAIQRVESSHMVYHDAQRRSRLIHLDRIQSIRFAGLDALDEAEEAFGDGDTDRALPHLLTAHVEAANDLQRLWIRARLVAVHDARGEYVEAAGHFAALVLLQEDSFWRTLSPRSKPVETTFAAANEALENIRRARERVRDRELASILLAMAARVEAVHRRAQPDDDGPTLTPRQTLSGIPIASIRAESFELSASKSTEGTSEDADEHGDDSAAAIDALLERGEWAEALNRCEQVAREPGSRELGHFLYQYGQALRGVGREADAAIMFSRCAILFRDSPAAPLSLIELAELYRKHYDRPRTAARLLERAALAERAHGREAVLSRIEALSRQAHLTFTPTGD